MNMVVLNPHVYPEQQHKLDIILITNEVVDEARCMHKELLLFKVDFEKAYDSVDFKYPDSVMANMNFPKLWRKWIYECIGTAAASVLVNGCPMEEFPIERGLCQGDPLSPFLFLLAVEGFNVLMNAVVGAEMFRGYGVGNLGEVRMILSLFVKRVGRMFVPYMHCCSYLRRFRG